MSSLTPSKRVGFLELFFDLVFVFAVTQLVGLLHDDHSARGWVHAAFMLWLVWWAWSQYAWAGNAIDLARRPTRVGLLAATAAMLAAAAAIPTAFSDDAGAWFTLPYVGVRLIGLGLYWWGVGSDPANRAAVRAYLPVALVGPLLVLIGGALDGDARLAVWGVAIVVDIASAIAGGRGEFRIDPAHFAERHGLIVIIALGESVIAIGATASGIGLTREIILIVTVAFAVVAGLWWCYFDWVHEAIERRLSGEPDHRRRGHLARDLFTFGHLPVVGGIVVFAAAIEEALLHPTDPLNSFGAAALAAGVGLYFGGFVVGNLRATGQWLPTRLAGLVAAVAVASLLGTRLDAVATVGLVALVVVGVALAERDRAVRLADEGSSS